MKRKLKTFYYGTYQYIGMKKPTNFLTDCKDCIPAAAFHPIKTIVANNKRDVMKVMQQKDPLGLYLNVCVEPSNIYTVHKPLIIYGPRTYGPDRDLLKGRKI